MSVRNRGTKTSPKKSVATKKSASPPSERPSAAKLMPPPLAKPVMRAMTPTQTMSSQTEVPRT